jgi:hypothetical protein
MPVGKVRIWVSFVGSDDGGLLARIRLTIDPPYGLGYFLLAAQKKIARRRGRDPDSIKRRVSDSFYLNNSFSIEEMF